MIIMAGSEPNLVQGILTQKKIKIENSLLSFNYMYTDIYNNSTNNISKSLSPLIHIVILSSFIPYYHLIFYLSCKLPINPKERERGKFNTSHISGFSFKLSKLTTPNQHISNHIQEEIQNIIS